MSRVGDVPTEDLKKEFIEWKNTLMISKEKIEEMKQEVTEKKSPRLIKKDHSSPGKWGTKEKPKESEESQINQGSYSQNIKK